MNVEDTIRRSLWHHPSVTHNRAHALHNLFYVIGNGYEWVDGELVNIFERELHDEDAYWFNINPGSKSGLTPEQLERMEPSRKGWDDYVDRIRDNIDFYLHDMTWDIEGDDMHQAMRARGATIWRPYPRSPSAHIRNIPEDCTPDWLLAAWEIANLIEPLYDTIGDMAQALRDRTTT